MPVSESRIWGSKFWWSRLWGSRISDNGFWIWMSTCLSRGLESGGLEYGGLESVGLESRPLDFAYG